MKKVKVRFDIRVEGRIGGSFEMSEADYKRLSAKLESRGNHHQETDLADELLSLAPFNYFEHLMVDDMEIDDFELQP